MDLVQYERDELPIHNIDYKTDITVFISAYNTGNKRGSKNCSRSFTTPSCLEIYGGDASAHCGETIVFVF